MSNTPTVPSQGLYDRLSHFDTVREWGSVFGKQSTEQKAQDVKNKQQPTGYVDKNHYRGLSSTQPTPEAADKKMAEVKVAQSLKNPLEAPNPQLQLVAHGAKLTRLTSDPKFSKLNNNLKLMVLQHYYSKYTEPILKANGVAPPGFDKWMQSQHADIYDQDSKVKPSTKGEFVSGVAEGTANLSRLLSNVLRYKLPWTPKFTDKVNQAAALKLVDAAHGLDSMNQNYHSVFQTDHSATGWMANTIGNVVGDGPAYIAADLATGGLGPEIEALIKVAPKMGLAAKYALEAGQMFAINKGEDYSTKEAAVNALTGPLIGFGINKLASGATRTVRKGFNKAGETILNHANAKGTQLAVMGKPFVNTVESHADRSEAGQKWLGEGNKQLGSGQKWLEKGKIWLGSGKTESHIKPDTAVMNKLGEHEQALRENIARQYYGHKINPDKPGGSIWRNLSKSQRGKINAYLSEMTKFSSEAMPLTSPHVQTLANQAEIDEWTKADPISDATHKLVMQVTGLNPAEVLTEVQAEKVAGHLGINTPTQHLDQAFNGPAENPEPKADSFEPLPSHLRGAKPRYGDMVPQFKSDVDKALYIVGNRWTKEGYYKSSSADNQYMTYLRRQFPDKSDFEIQEMGRELKGKVKEAHSSADKNQEWFNVPSVSGGSGRLKSGYTVDYSKRNDNATTKDIISSNGEDFINKTLKYLEDSPSTKSGKIYFEHPEHHLLHIAENSDAPAAIKNKAVGFLAREFGHDPGTIERRAGWLKEHVDDLRRTGLLESKGNIYRSTKLNQRRYGTTWQRELYTEDSYKAHQAQLKELLKQNPKLKAVIKPLLKELLTLKNKSTTPTKLGVRADNIDQIIESLQGLK